MYSYTLGFPNAFVTSLGEEFDGSLLSMSWAKPVEKQQAKNFGKSFYGGVAMYQGGSGGEMVPRSPTSTQDGNMHPQLCRLYALPPTTLPLWPVFSPPPLPPPPPPPPPPQSSPFGSQTPFSGRTKKIFISGLQDHLTREDIWRYFWNFGEVCYRNREGADYHDYS